MYTSEAVLLKIALSLLILLGIILFSKKKKQNYKVLFLDPKQLVEKYNNDLEQIKTGQLFFFGIQFQLFEEQKFTFSNLEYSEKEKLLKFYSENNEILSIWNPQDIRYSVFEISIMKADKIRLTFNYFMQGSNQLETSIFDQENKNYFIEIANLSGTLLFNTSEELSFYKESKFQLNEAFVKIKW